MVIIDIDQELQERVTCVDSDRLTNMRDTVARCDRGKTLIESGTFPSASGVEAGKHAGQGARVQGVGHWGHGAHSLASLARLLERSPPV